MIKIKPQPQFVNKDIIDEFNESNFTRLLEEQKLIICGLRMIWGVQKWNFTLCTLVFPASFTWQCF